MPSAPRGVHPDMPDSPPQKFRDPVIERRRAHCGYVLDVVAHAEALQGSAEFVEAPAVCLNRAVVDKDGGPIFVLQIAQFSARLDPGLNLLRGHDVDQADFKPLVGQVPQSFFQPSRVEAVRKDHGQSRRSRMIRVLTQGLVQVGVAGRLCLFERLENVEEVRSASP